jgi:hypothetical protein
VSCTDENAKYRNDIYKAIINNHNIVDMGLINGALTALDTLITKNIDAINIESYDLFKSLYGNYQDSIAVDSVLFIDNILICFGITTVGGDILDSYTYNLFNDTLNLICKVKLWDGSVVPRLAKAYIITFKNIR